MVKSALGVTKYVIIGNFETSGYIDKSDLIGSLFGQTEGLIGEDLEFSELQKKGKLGRIEINLSKRGGKTKGNFTIPTALDKIEVSLVAAAIESITKISHTSGKIKITQIRDDRKDKRDAIKKRAEELLKNLKEELPESSDLTNDVLSKVRIDSVKKYDKEVFGGSNILEDEEIILVEGVADVKNLLKHNISNVLSFGGSSIPKFVKNISKNKKIIAFLDGDRGGKNELEELLDTANIDYYTFAQDGKEVEELNIKEITKALKNKIKVEKDVKDENLLDKIKDVFVKNSPKVKKELVKARDLVDNKINEVQEKVVYKNKKKDNLSRSKIKDQSKSKENKKQINLQKSKKQNFYIKKNEIETLKKKIKNLENNKDKDFMILNSNLRCIKSGSIDDFMKLGKLNQSKYLLFDGVMMKTTFGKSKGIGVKIILSKKKSSRIDSNGLIVKTFDEVLSKN